MLGWGGIVRLCLVNAAIGGMAALPINLFNRLMTVELALPAILPGLLVALHYGVQLTRPVWGHRSDRTGSRAPFIRGGLAALGLALVATAWGVGVAETNLAAALVIWIAAFIVIGLAIGAAGTSFLALLAAAAPEGRHGAAATIAWLMLILGAIVASVGVGIALEPYGPARLLVVIAAAAGIAWIVAALAVHGLERRLPARPAQTDEPLIPALRAAWAEPSVRRFTMFVFLSIFAFFLSELVFEPFAGHVHGLTPDQSTQLSGGKDGAALMGMLAAGMLSTLGFGALRVWAVAGCLLSALGLAVLAAGMPLLPGTVVLGFGNGLFVVGAIGSMMRLAVQRAEAAGIRMGVFGAAQAISAGLAGLIATGTLDLLRLGQGDAAAYGALFYLQAAIFVLAGAVAMRVLRPAIPALVPGE